MATDNVTEFNAVGGTFTIKPDPEGLILTHMINSPIHTVLIGSIEHEPNGMSITWSDTIAQLYCVSIGFITPHKSQGRWRYFFRSASDRRTAVKLIGNLNHRDTYRIDESGDVITDDELVSDNLLIHVVNNVAVMTAMTKSDHIHFERYVGTKFAPRMYTFESGRKAAKC